MISRLLGWAYSSGELFQYSYNAAYQLETAQEDGGALWTYSHDSEGRLVEVAPDTGPEGSRRYSYNTAGFLEQVEVHD